MEYRRGRITREYRRWRYTSKVRPLQGWEPLLGTADFVIGLERRLGRHPYLHKQTGGSGDQKDVARGSITMAHMFPSLAAFSVFLGTLFLVPLLAAQNN
jgi:hypothetical protein